MVLGYAVKSATIRTLPMPQNFGSGQKDRARLRNKIQQSSGEIRTDYRITFGRCPIGQYRPPAENAVSRLIGRAWRCFSFYSELAGLDTGSAAHAGSLCCSGPVGCGIRCVTPRSQGQLAAGSEPGLDRGRADRCFRSNSGSIIPARYPLAGCDCPRRDCGAARCVRSNGCSADVASPTSSTRHFGGGEPF